MFDFFNISDEEFESLLFEIRLQETGMRTGIDHWDKWHWKGPFSLTSKVEKYMKKLRSKNDPRAEDLKLALIQTKGYMERYHYKINEHNMQKIIELIGSESELDAWTTADIPKENYTNESQALTHINEALNFANTQGSILQSARESAIYQINNGPEDNGNMYFTRTIGIYFKENKRFFLAFDDDPVESVFFSQETISIINQEWLLDAKNPSIKNAIDRAKKNNRILQITKYYNTSYENIWRCIIGDKYKEYLTFKDKKYIFNQTNYFYDYEKCNEFNNDQVLCTLFMMSKDHTRKNGTYSPEKMPQKIKKAIGVKIAYVKINREEKIIRCVTLAILQKLKD
jgi:hypothetical protein